MYCLAIFSASSFNTPKNFYSVTFLVSTGLAFSFIGFYSIVFSFIGFSSAAFGSIGIVFYLLEGSFNTSVLSGSKWRQGCFLNLRGDWAADELDGSAVTAFLAPVKYVSR